ncbi:MAG: LLM class flavin-dependent oxidoreductase [Acidimicrobiales bacterium]
MHIGLALSQFDLPTGWDHVLGWATVRDRAQLAERLGFESLWLADQVVVDATSADRRPRVGGYDPLVALGALARTTHRARLGTLLFAFLRPAAVLAKALATLDVVSAGRLVVGLGPSGVPGLSGDAAPLGEVCQVLAGMFGGGPFSFTGAHIRVTDARCLPLPVQRPHPPIWLGGDGDDLLDMVARHAEGWNAAGAWTPDAYRQRLNALDVACERVGRDPATVTRSLGLTALVGESGADLERRFRRLRDVAPAAVPGSTTFDEWRRGRLVATVDEVGAGLEEWSALGVDTVVLGAGGDGFSVTEPDDMAMLAASCSLKPV